MQLLLVGAANPQVGPILRRVAAATPDLQFMGFLDNDPRKRGRQFAGATVLGGFDLLPSLDLEHVRFVNLISRTTEERLATSRVIATAGGTFTNLIDPGVGLDGVTLGAGNYIQGGVTLEHSVDIADNSVVCTAALVSHECRIGHSVFIGPRACLAGLVTVGDGAYIGANATILPRLSIGRWSTVGAGAVVLADVPDGATVVGNPARVIVPGRLNLGHGRLRA